MSKSSDPYTSKPQTMTDTTDPPSESTTSFYKLLFSDPIQTALTDSKSSVIDNYVSPDYSDSFYGPNPPKMVCFGGYKKVEEEEAICSEITAPTTKQMVCQSESSSASSANSIKTSSNPNRKRNGSGQILVKRTVELVNDVSLCKRGKSDKTTAAVAAKLRTRPKPARKEKIGERIATLQQLVSPFGKTDTASVLHEALCYIKFLHDQIQVLSSPYLHQLSFNQAVDGLKRRGLCLVPVAYTAELASPNGADYWASAARGNGTRK